jgi:putative transposase
LLIERLWRNAKYEEVYLKAYQDGKEAVAGIGEHFPFYDTERPHQALLTVLARLLTSEKRAR